MSEGLNKLSIKQKIIIWAIRDYVRVSAPDSSVINFKWNLIL